MKLHYTISGSGEAVLFIHGAYVNSEIWNYQHHFFKDYFQVVSVDLRGHGQTPPTELNQYSVSTFGEDIIHLLDQLGIEKVTLFGLSLGSMVAQYLAANYPSRVNGIVLVGATASLRLSISEKVITTVLFPKWLAMRLFGRLSTNRFMKISFFLTWFMLGNKWLGNSMTREKIRRSIAKIPKGELKKIYHAIHSFRKQNLKSGSYPVLLVNGENDSRIIHKHSKYIAKKVGHRATQHIVSAAGHACNHDQPFAFNKMVFDWMIESKLLQIEPNAATEPLLIEINDAAQVAG